MLTAGGTPDAVALRPAVRAAAPAPSQKLDAEVRVEAQRLRRRLAVPPRPIDHGRDPFAFADAPSRAPRRVDREPVPLALAVAPAVLVADEPPLTLIGVAESQRNGTQVRTAIVGGADELWMLEAGQMLGSRYRVEGIGPDWADLVETSTGTSRRLVFR